MQVGSDNSFSIRTNPLVSSIPDIPYHFNLFRKIAWSTVWNAFLISTNISRSVSIPRSMSRRTESVKDIVASSVK